MNVGATAGIIVGVIVGLMCVGVIIYCCWKKNKKDKLAQGYVMNILYVSATFSSLKQQLWHKIMLEISTFLFSFLFLSFSGILDHWLSFRSPEAVEYHDTGTPDESKQELDKSNNPTNPRTELLNQYEENDDLHQNNHHENSGISGRKVEDDQHSYDSGKGRQGDKGSDQHDRRGSRDRLDDQRDRYGGSRDRLDDQRDRYSGSRDRLDDRRDRNGGSRDRLDDHRDRSGGSRDRLDDRRDRHGGSRDRLDDQRDKDQHRNQYI